MKTVLIIDDDVQTLQDLRLFADALGLNVLRAVSGNQAIRMLISEDQEINAIVTDTRMYDGDGIEVLQAIWALDLPDHLKVLIHSGDTDYMVRGEKIKLADYVSKYFGTFAKFCLKEGSKYTGAKAFLTEITKNS